ncbi:MAG: hypothetical protein QXU75_09630, partial [Candidatus Methanomethylicaceae archaeon]
TRYSTSQDYPRRNIFLLLVAATQHSTQHASSIQPPSASVSCGANASATKLAADGVNHACTLFT